ncbi:MAG: hypothetical protein KJ831_07815, partial [Candidatus Eisenbacteria bacterium]|nr:hypothetical protein [Candidatus Eisenbacteria bacterium]
MRITLFSIMAVMLLGLSLGSLSGDEVSQTEYEQKFEALKSKQSNLNPRELKSDSEIAQIRLEI